MILVQKTIDQAKQTKQLLVFLKLDFVKAYDRLLEGFFFNPSFTQPNEAIENLYACSFFPTCNPSTRFVHSWSFPKGVHTSTSFDFIGLGLELFPFDLNIDSCRFVF